MGEHSAARAGRPSPRHLAARVAGAAPATVAAGAPRADPGPLLDVEPTAWLRRVGARVTFVHTIDGVPRVVKRDEEPAGWRGFLSTGLPGGPSRAEREFENLVQLALDGLPVPRAVAWAARRRGRCVQSAVVMERVEHAETLRERLARAGADEQRAWCERLSGLVLALHGRGWYHRDLYLQHLVLRAPEERATRSVPGHGGPAPELVLLDVARARREPLPRERWFVKDLAALLHSTPRAVSTPMRLRFAARYLDGRGILDRRARRALLARVRAKERRMAAHAPRRGEERPWTDR